MAAAKDDFIYKGYGCPNTEMWTRRAAFEEAHPGLNTFMKQDAPHFANAKTRIAYAKWEAALERVEARETVRDREVLEAFADMPEISGELNVERE
jgi:hypothetical protein